LKKSGEKPAELPENAMKFGKSPENVPEIFPRENRPENVCRRGVVSGTKRRGRVPGNGLHGRDKGCIIVHNRRKKTVNRMT
jgi:hypothetical protein